MIPTRCHLLLATLLLAGSPGFGKVLDDWSRVEAIPLGKTVTVAIRHGVSVVPLPNGKRKITGVFASASKSSISIHWKNSRAVVIAKDSVRRVSSRIPIGRRVKGWIGTAIVFGAVQSFLSFALDFDDLTPRSFLQAHAGFTTPAGFLFLRGFGARTIYNVP